jgi:hypothetical protein
MTKRRVDVDQIRQELEEHYSSASPQDREAIESLLRLAEELTNAIAPARPRAEFRQRFGDELVAVVRDRPPVTIAPGPANRRRALLVGATVGSLLPLFGVVAYLLMSRLTSKPQHAASH